MQRRAFLCSLAGLGALATGSARAATARADSVLVFAAASLKTALDAVAAQWHRDTGNAAVISYAASSALAKQIENGAPADLFISADLKWMDYLQAAQADRAEKPRRPARQQPGAGRAEGQSGAGENRPRLSARQAAGRRAPRDGRAQLRAGRDLRQGGADLARRLAGRRDATSPRRENVRAALLAGGARRGAARHRLPDRRARRAGRDDRRHLSGRQPSADHLSDGADDAPPASRPRPLRPICADPPPTGCSRRKASPCSTASGERALRLLAGRADRDPPVAAGRVLGDAVQPAGRTCGRADAGARPVSGARSCSTRSSTCRSSCRRSSPAICCCCCSAEEVRSGNCSPTVWASFLRSAGPARHWPAR